MEDPNGQPIYIIGKEDYGYRVADNKDQLLFKIKRSNTRITVESASGKTEMEIKGIDDLFAASAIALAKLDEQQRVALMVLLNRKASAGK